MIDYQTFCRLRQLHDEQGLKVSQIAAELHLDLRLIVSSDQTCGKPPGPPANPAAR